MKNPFPNITIEFETKAFSIDVTNTENNSIINYGDTKDITIYEYETKKNEDKRQILILKKEYLGVFISDMKNIMTYDKSSQTIDNKTKKV
jgi:uncharacterized protein (DUF488 family)